MPKLTVTIEPLTPAQALLLRAVTLPAEQALDAWNRWTAEVVVDDLEADSQWLLPLLFVRLCDAGVSAAALDRYANVFRHNWYKSHVRLRALEPVMDTLRGLGHEPVLVGGASLAVGYYPVIGARPFDSLMIATPQSLTVAEIREAERCLPAEVGAALRWQTGCRPTATREASTAGRTLSVPDAPDALIQVFATAAGRSRNDDLSELLWAVDAVTVGRTLDSNGWATVWRIAADQDLTATVESCLEWLRTVGLRVDGTTAT